MNNIINIPLDEHCQSLVEEINAYIPVEMHQNTEYTAVIRKENGKGDAIKAEITYYVPINYAKLAHELLHCKINMLLGDNSCMLTVLTICPYAQRIFDRQFFVDILNQSEHLIMYSEYARMGYSPDEFFESIEDFSSKVEELKKIGLCKNGRYILESVGVVMRLCILYCLFPIDNRFKIIKKQLRKLEPSIYATVKAYAEQLSTIRLDSADCSRLQSIYSKFSSDLVYWVNSHDVVPSFMALNNVLFSGIQNSK